MAGKIALVTGAGTGIGRASAMALARAGFVVALAGRRPEPLEDVAAAIAAEGGSGVALPTDVADAAAVGALFAQIDARFGRLDLLFNNAGMGAKPVALEDHPLDLWEQIVSVNLTGTFLCTRAAFRLMKRQDPGGGRIINNGSISAHVPRPDSVAYTATKHAITGLTKAAALDGRRFGIACGQIDIGNAATDPARLAQVSLPQADGSSRAEPWIDVGHVADSVVFMAGMPLQANVQFLTVTATRMPFIGRG